MGSYVTRAGPSLALRLGSGLSPPTEVANMSITDLVAKWDEALAAAHRTSTLDQEELSEDQLEAAALPCIGARSGLRAGAQDTSLLGGCSGDCTGMHACPS